MFRFLSLGNWIHSLNCSVPSEFSSQFTQDAPPGTALAGTDVVQGSVVQERQLAVWSPRTPWEERYQRPYRWSKLVPFGGVAGDCLKNFQS